MASTGLLLFLFVVGHLIGNLQVFLGPESINRYGAFLQSLQELLWPVRAVMLTLVTLHFWSASRLTLENRAARPVPYTTWNPTVASYASRTMFLGGLVIATFIVYHLLHYTALVKVGGADFSEAAGFKYTLKSGTEVHNIFKMLIVGFNVKWVSCFYILSIFLLSVHLSHGVKAMFQSLGLKSKGYDKAIGCFAPAIATFIFLGYSSIPVAIMLGFLK